jgi:hypothetical protein
VSSERGDGRTRTVRPTAKSTSTRPKSYSAGQRQAARFLDNYGRRCRAERDRDAREERIEAKLDELLRLQRQESVW